jgi:hypothetical protein
MCADDHEAQPLNSVSEEGGACAASPSCCQVWDAGERKSKLRATVLPRPFSYPTADQECLNTAPTFQNYTAWIRALAQARGAGRR